MDADSVIAGIKKLSPAERRKVEEALHAEHVSHGNGDEISSKERVRRFDELMAKVPAVPGPPADASRDSIYE